MLLATNHSLQETLNEPRITLDALEQVKGLEVQLDRLMAELTPSVMMQAHEHIQPVIPIIEKAQALIKSMQPPQPMDPSVVAQQDIQRQQKADDAKAAGDAEDRKIKDKEVETKAAIESQKVNAKQQSDNLKAQTDVAKTQADIDRENQQAQAQQDAAEKKHLIDAANIKVASDRNDVTAEAAQEQSDTTLKTTEMDNETAIEIEKMAIKAGKHKPAISNGKGVGGKK
jgi:epidermal growth factor receptor substrate 15